MIGSGLVATVQALTAERIEKNHEVARLRSLNEVIPSQRYDNDILADVITLHDETLAGKYKVLVYRARKQEKPVAAVFETVAPAGYAGPIRMLVGVNMDGTIAGVRILEHKETPGLGDAIEVERSDWILGFDYKSIGNPKRALWGVKRDGGVFDQFTGATITPRLVVKTVKKSLIYFNAHKEQLFKAKPKLKPTLIENV
jgi:electron transport complex protein RnfG